MTAQEYMQSLLVAQRVTDPELKLLRGLRECIEARLSSLQGSPRFYYGGSYGKDTMILNSLSDDLSYQQKSGIKAPIWTLLGSMLVGQ
jgi:hypothetical protein